MVEVGKRLWRSSRTAALLREGLGRAGCLASSIYHKIKHCRSYIVGSASTSSCLNDNFILAQEPLGTSLLNVTFTIGKFWLQTCGLLILSFKNNDLEVLYRRYDFASPVDRAA